MERDITGRAVQQSAKIVQRVMDRAGAAAETVGGREQGLEAMMGGGEGGRVPVALENEGMANAGV